MNEIYMKILLFLINKLNIFNNTNNKCLQNSKVRLKKNMQRNNHYTYHCYKL